VGEHLRAIGAQAPAFRGAHECLLDRGEGTEALLGELTRLRGLHSLLDEVARAHLDVELQFVADLALRARPKDRAQPRPHVVAGPAASHVPAPASRAHAGCAAAWSTLATAAAKRVHVADSVRSCVRPSGVSL